MATVTQMLEPTQEKTEIFDCNPHQWHIFRDNEVKGWLSFFCSRCLKITKREINYEK